MDGVFLSGLKLLRFLRVQLAVAAVFMGMPLGLLNHHGTPAHVFGHGLVIPLAMMVETSYRNLFRNV